MDTTHVGDAIPTTALLGRHHVDTVSGPVVHVRDDGPVGWQRRHHDDAAGEPQTRPDADPDRVENAVTVRAVGQDDLASQLVEVVTPVDDEAPRRYAFDTGDALGPELRACYSAITSSLLSVRDEGMPCSGKQRVREDDERRS